MKMLLIVCACLSSVGLFAQQPAGGSQPQGTGNPTLASKSPGESVVRGATPAQTGAITGNHVQVTGPLAQPFKANVSAGPLRRLVNLVNPFAPSEPKPEAEPRVKGVSPRAWTTVAGWNPGGSVFQNEATHEPSMSLVSVTRSK